MNARPIPAADLPLSLGPWTWAYAIDRVWARRQGLAIWAAPNGPVRLAVAATPYNGIAASASAPMERVHLGAVGVIPGNSGDYVILSGGVYDWDLISVARIQWPEAKWFAPPGVVARTEVAPGTAGVGATAWVGKLAVAVVSAIAAMPEEVL